MNTASGRHIDGTIIYTEVMCDHVSYTYVSRDFVELNLTYPQEYKTCARLYKPSNWQQMGALPRHYQETSLPS